MTPDQLLPSALAHHQAGNLHAAQQIYRQILAQKPDHHQALHLLGVALWQSSPAEAEPLIRRAIEIAPDPQYVNNLAIFLMNAGRTDEALPLLRHGLAGAPDNLDLRFTLAAALQNRAGGEAENLYREILARNPNHLGAWNNLGMLLKTRAAGTRSLDDAAHCFQRATALNPRYMEAWANLAELHYDRGSFEDAVACASRALAISPRQPVILARLGASLLALRRADEAIAACRRAIELQPGNLPARNDLASALILRGNLDDAEAALREALQLDPNLPELCSNLALISETRGMPDDAIALYRKALAIRPHARIHSNLLYTLHFSPNCTPRQILEEHQQWNALHAAHLAPPPELRTRNSELKPRLRIGYVSPDFYENVIGRFMLPLLREHDRTQFEIVCYYANNVHDAMTARLQQHSDIWRNINGMSDEEAAALVRSDGIDILIDLTMHMRNSRLLLFALKPAPVQMTYLAFCSTTGLAAMDFRISDWHLDPPESDLSVYSERTLHLPGCYWCYEVDEATGKPPEGSLNDVPSVRELPAMTRGHITFGSLNSFSKVSSLVIDAWTQILSRVSDARILLHAKDGKHKALVYDRFERAGIARTRVEFVGTLPLARYFDLYNRIDIALDPFPYAGGTTTCDALFMGVPVVTLRGKTAVGRGGVSILSTLGPPATAWIAHDEPAYIAAAVNLAQDLHALAQTRQHLRPWMQHSALMNAPAFARGMEQLFRSAWLLSSANS
ncbi:MAG TPA: tetratricopeptide repeat protein [Phycisphaerae bacterium]|nr:tetratricopeptide repeat protein [Phycisphaerae bacterium]